MKKKRPPKEVRHDWQKKPTHFKRGGFIHECSACQLWTAHLFSTDKYEVCEAKDRRKGKKDRRA